MAILFIGRCTNCFEKSGHAILINTRFSDEHAFVKPNDERALKLMDHAAQDLMSEFKDIVLAFGESDEFRCAQILR